MWAKLGNGLSSTLPQAVRPPERIAPLTDATNFNAQGVSTVVLDAGAFITGAQLTHFGPDCAYVTTERVLAEVKDGNARRYLATFPFKITEVAVTEEALDAVSRFARFTGDYVALSRTDLEVIALHYMLEKRVHGSGRINLRPKEIPTHHARTRRQREVQVEVDANEPSPFIAFESKAFGVNSYLSSSSSSSSPSSPRASADSADNNASVSIADVDVATDPAAASSAGATDPKEKSAPQAAADAEDDWINPDNIYLQRTNDDSIAKASKKTAQVEAASTVVCVTTDYAMQNVILQQGLRLMNVNGFAIKQIKIWKKVCYTCNTLVRDMSRQFCPSCGGNTLTRGSVRVSADGVLRYSTPYKKRFSKRGTKFTIPKPRGGRVNKDLKMREDVVYDMERARHMKKHALDMFESAAEFGLGKAKAKGRSHVVGHGRRNVNEVRLTTRKNKRNRRRK
jgi:RNA-binding protein NOB1